MRLEFRCTIHNLLFGADSHDDLDVIDIKCPLCAKRDLAALHKKLEQVTDHRDTLLRAIEIKTTVKP